MKTWSTLRKKKEKSNATSAGAATDLNGRTPTQESNAMAMPTEAPPDGGYGWVVCGALSNMNGFTWGVAASYGVYLSHYLESDYFPGATPLDYAFIGGIEFGAAMLISPACTILARELGRTVVMTSGVVMMAGGFIAASFAKQIWQIYLSQGNYSVV